ncbi:MAG: sugar ABC transporter permease [Eubacteriales bacterium]
MTKPEDRALNVQRLRKQGARKRKRRDWLVHTAYLTPSLAGVMLFFFLPLLVIVYNSSLKSVSNSTFVGLDNYTNVLGNQAFVLAMKNTFLFSALAVPLAVLLSLLLALLLNTKIPGRSWFRSVFLNPMMVPVASVVLIWQVFFSFNGTLNSFLGGFGLEKIDWMKSDWSRLVILLLFLWKNLGYNMVLFLSALNYVPEELLDSAKIDGAGSIKRFFHVSMVYLYPTIFFVGIMSLINSFKIFREVYLLTGAHPVNALYLLQHFMNNAFAKLEYQKLSSAAIIMCLGMIAIVGVLFIAENRLGRDVEE